MNREYAMDLNFPLAFFLQVKQEIMSDINVIEKEKAIWLAVRNSLDKSSADALDEKFKRAFDQLGGFFHDGRVDRLQDIFQSLHVLVRKGAAAKLLRNHKLGTYNLAMLIQRIPQITDQLSLEWVIEIIKLTIIAGANLKAQRAYSGKSGTTSLGWVCLYLADGVRDTGYIRRLDQYTCCYKIFPWLLESGMAANTKVNRNPFNTFLAALRDSPEVADWQEEIMLAMMCYGFSPFTPNDIYQSASFFSHIAAINVKWLCMIFPFEDDHVKHYLSVLQPNVTPEVAKNLINGFTSNNKTRKHFKAFFSMKAHWLLQYISESAPEIIFSLVKRNEQDMLVPFLKNFKPAMIELRDANGNTLLHQAVLCRGLVENTIQLLRNARLSTEIVNNEGLTPLALAMKNNRTDLIKWLK